MLRFRREVNNMELKDTIEWMQSADYKKRFRAEYHQLNIRIEKLCSFLYRWDNNMLDFTPSTPRSVYDLQIRAMQDYLAVLEARAAIEDIDLSQEE